MEHGTTILIGVVAGVAARLYMLRSDYRQYPGYPHGYVTHISLGAVAAAIGAVAIPALVEKEFAAVSFLALAAQQFREVREMERKSLARLEELELVPRGYDYIEGIARVFESRNYLAMGVSFIASAAAYQGGWMVGAVIGLAVVFVTTFFMRGEVVGDIAEVVPAKLEFRGSVLTVGGVPLMNVGLPEAREKILREGLGVVISPKDDRARATLHNVGQRQAIVHTAAALLGTKVDVGEISWMPIARKHIDSGAIAVFILPQEPDVECLVEAINRTPVLESAKRNPLLTRAGRRAAD